MLRGPKSRGDPSAERNIQLGRQNNKMSYWYQLGVYIEILKALNPDKKISALALIDWVKIKKEKWVYNKNFNVADWNDYINMEAHKYTWKLLQCLQEIIQIVMLYVLDNTITKHHTNTVYC